MRPRPTLEQEKGLLDSGYHRVAGVDEAGRGPLAGPVVAAAVILSLDQPPPWWAQIRDSKQLSQKQREDLCQRIRQEAIAIGVGIVDQQTIDRVGIGEAACLAMYDAIGKLQPSPDFILIDFVRLPRLRVPYTALVKGDARCVSIAAASIIAKVTRDSLMLELDRRYPSYRFAAHKGYPTREHLRLLQQLGPSPVHRRSFRPVRALLDGRA